MVPWPKGNSGLPAPEKARATGWWAEILFKALSSRVKNRWRFVSFRGTGGGEWRGVVDILAIRKDTSRPDNPALRRGDLFETILVQVKGGSARKPKAADIQRLKVVKKRYGSKHIVLFEWKKGTASNFSTLIGEEWRPSSAEEIFGVVRGASGRTTFPVG